MYIRNFKMKESSEFNPMAPLQILCIATNSVVASRRNRVSTENLRQLEMLLVRKVPVLCQSYSAPTSVRMHPVQECEMYQE